MSNKFLSSLTIKNKLLLVILLMISFIVMMAAISLSFSAKRNKELIESLEDAITVNFDMSLKEQMDTVISLIASINEQYKTGKYTLEEAKTLSADIIREMRYGTEGYFWVDNLQGDNIVLYGSEVEGTNRIDYEDTQGKKIIREIIYLATEKGGGYTDYWFPKEGEKTATKKRSYVALYEPYGWVIGTGVYVDELDKVINEERTKQQNALKDKTNIFIGLIVVYIFMAYTIMRIVGYNISKPLEETIREAKRISNGDFNQDIRTHLMTRKDEVGQLAIALDKMKNSLQSLIKDLHMKAEHMESEKEFLRTTLVAVGDGVISTDENGIVHMFNKAAERLTGWKEEDAVGREFDKIFLIYNEETGEPFNISIQEVLQTGESYEMENNMVLVSKDNTKTLIESQTAPIKNSKGELTGTVLVFRDITERKKKLEEIRYLSIHDQLTGLYNRRFFEDEIINIDIQSNYPLSFIMADINGLKITNDAFGHYMGDRLILKTAELLKKINVPGAFISRIGGDEFFLVLPNTNYEEARRLIRKVEKDMADEMVDSVQVSISLGAAEKASLLENSADVIKRAEEQMYKKKLIESPIAKMKILKEIEMRMNEKYKDRKLYSTKIEKACECMGLAMNLSPSKIENLKVASMYWDIGKITVDTAFEGSHSKNTDMEYYLQSGYHILKSISRFAEASEIILAHHENWDGSGFPRQLSKELIPIESRILAVIVYYYTIIRKEKNLYTGLEKALELVKNNSGTKFDPEVVVIFLEELKHINDTLFSV